jgi:hypothetical protein
LLGDCAVRQAILGARHTKREVGWMQQAGLQRVMAFAAVVFAIATVVFGARLLLLVPR